MNYSTMTTKALNIEIRRYENLIAHCQDAIRSINHNYRKCTDTLNLEAKAKQIKDREEAIAWHKESLSLIRTELQNRA